MCISPASIQLLEEAKAWLTLRNVQECHDTLERIPPEERGGAHVLDVRLDMFIQAKAWPYALAVAEALHKEFPDDPRVLYRFAVACLNIGQKERARELIGEVLRKWWGFLEDAGVGG